MLALLGGCADVVKVDIEGAEHRLWSRTAWGALCAGMLLVEVHGQPEVKGELRAAGERRHSIGHTVQMVRALEAHGLLHYSTEMVCPLCPAQMELGFVNVSWLRARLSLAAGSAWVHEDGVWNPAPMCVESTKACAKQNDGAAAFVVYDRSAV